MTVKSKAKDFEDFFNTLSQHLLVTFDWWDDGKSGSLTKVYFTPHLLSEKALPILSFAVFTDFSTKQMTHTLRFI